MSAPIVSGAADDPALEIVIAGGFYSQEQGFGSGDAVDGATARDD